MKKKLLNHIQKILLRHVKIITIAMLIDALWGDPPSIYKKIPHPIIWIGNLIQFFDRKFNIQHYSAKKKKIYGFITIGCTIAIPTYIGYLLQKNLFKFFPKPIAYFLCGIFCSIFIARRSLYEHVQNVETALNQQDIQAARHEVSQIVGRKTDHLDQSGIVRAAIESLAENFSDGVTAPIFWGTIAGLPGIIAYKAINTADSMIGHKTKKHQHFGYAAAKTDDYANYPAARLSTLLIIIAASQNTITDLIYTAKEAKKHNSPNAGWPESAMAICLSIYLAGPRHYQDYIVNSPWIGKGRKTLTSRDIYNALSIFSTSCNIFFIISFIVIINSKLFYSNKS